MKEAQKIIYVHFVDERHTCPLLICSLPCWSPLTSVCEVNSLHLVSGGVSRSNCSCRARANCSSFLICSSFLKNMNKNKPLEQSFNDTVTLRRECSTYVKNQKKSKISRVDTQLPCGAKFLRGLIFAIFEVFFNDPQKKKPYRKNIFSKNLLHCRNYIQNITFYTKSKIVLVPINSKRLFNSGKKQT